MQKQPFKRGRDLNTFDTLYDKAYKTQLFNQEDWNYAASHGTIAAYADMLFNVEKDDTQAFKSKYNWDYADSKTRLAALYNETAGDRDNRQTKRQRQLFNPNGTPMLDANNKPKTEDYFASDYEYNLELIRKQNDMNQQQKDLELAQELKDARGTWEKIEGYKWGIGSSLWTGIAQGIDNLNAIVGGVLDVITKDADTSVSDAFVKSVSSDKHRHLQPVINTLVDFERNYTGYRNLDGTYTDVGRYIGGLFTSVGEMLPSWAIGRGLGAGLSKIPKLKLDTAMKISSTVSQGSFYVGMTAGNIQETYKNFVDAGATPDSSWLIANAVIKSGVQWGIEAGLGKLLGTSALDSMLYGRKIGASVGGKTLTRAGINTILKDAGQEGLEEILQDSSDFFINLGFSHYLDSHYATEGISWSSLMDAYILGAVMSLGGSAIRIMGVNPIVDGDTKMNRIASWQYGVNMQSFVENSNRALELAEKTFNAESNTFTPFTGNDARKAKAAATSAYAAFRLLTSIYQEIGDERFKAANDILTSITDDIKINYFSPAMIKSYATTMRLGFSILADNKKKALEEELKRGKVQNVVDKVTKEDESESTVSDGVKEKLKDLDVDGVTVTDGNIATEVETDDGVELVISENKVGESAQTIAVELGVNKLVREVSQRFISDSKYSSITEAYKVYACSDKVTSDEVATALLFDINFFESVLNIGNKDVYQLLSALVDMEKAVVRGKLRDNVYRERIHNAVDNWVVALTMYCVNHIDADPNMFLYAIADTELRESTRKMILRERISQDIYNKVIKGDKLSDSEQRVLEIRIDNAYDPDTAKTLKENLQSPRAAVRQGTINSLNEKYHSEYYNNYDNKTYLQEHNMAEAVFNTFLKTTGLTLQTLLSDKVLTDEDVKYIEDKYGKLSIETIKAYRDEQFSQFTNGKFGFKITKEGSLLLTDDSEYVGYARQGKNLNETYDPDTSSISYDERQMVDEVSKRNRRIKDIVNPDLPASVVSYLTIDDVINDSTLLSANVKKAIVEFMKNKYGKTISGPNPEATFLYLRHYFSDTYPGTGLVVLQDGSYGFATLSSMFSCFKSSKISIDENTTIEDIFKEKKIPYGLKLKVIDNTDSTADAFFTPYREDVVGDEHVLIIDNTIYVSKQILKESQNYVKFVLAHEFQHAIQFANRMNNGMSSNWTKAVKKGTLKTIIEDIRKHKPDLFKDVKVGSPQEEHIVSNFVYAGCAESMAYGLEGNDILDYYPVISKLTKDGTEITLPWGTTFHLDAEDVSVPTSAIISSTQTIIETDAFIDFFSTYNSINLKATNDISAKSEKYQDNIDKTSSNKLMEAYHDSDIVARETANNYKKAILSFMLNKNPVGTNGETFHDMMVENLYVDLRINMSYDEFLKSEIPYVRIERKATDEVYKTAIVGKNKAALENGLIIYCDTGDVDINDKLVYGKIKVSDIYGYVNDKGLRQIFIPTDTKAVNQKWTQGLNQSNIVLPSMVENDYTPQSNLNPESTYSPKFVSDFKTVSRDDSYKAAVELNDMAKAEMIIEEAAREAGYNSPKLYHGTDTFGFTEIDIEKQDDQTSFFVTDDLDIAGSYTVMGPKVLYLKDASIENAQHAEEFIQTWHELGDEILKDTDKLYLRVVKSKKLSSNNEYKTLRNEVKEILNLLSDRLPKLNKLPLLIKVLNDNLSTLFEYLVFTKNTDFPYVKSAPANFNTVLEAMSENSDEYVELASLCNYYIKTLAFLETRMREKAGVYQFYGNMDNTLSIDAKGNAWNNVSIDDIINTFGLDILIQYKKYLTEIREKLVDEWLEKHPDAKREYAKIANFKVASLDKSIGRAKDAISIYGAGDSTSITPPRFNTREIGMLAKVAGYSGVVINKVHDIGRYGIRTINKGERYNHQGSVYMFFEPKRQLKSADPVVYDSKGELVPASKRFNPEHRDIRSADIKRRDDAYFEAQSTGDDEKAAEIIRDAAIDAGYDSPKLYHGTRVFGFTKLDLRAQDDDTMMFTSSSIDLAATYSDSNAKVTPLTDIEFPTTDKSTAKLKNQIKTEGSNLIYKLKSFVPNNITKTEKNVLSEAQNRLEKSLDVLTVKQPFVEFIKKDFLWFIKRVLILRHPEVTQLRNRYTFSVSRMLDIAKETNSDFINFVNEYENYIDNLKNEENDFTYYEDIGIYQFYGNLDNMLIVDAKGSVWNDLDVTALAEIDDKAKRFNRLMKAAKFHSESYTLKTRAIGQAAKTAGYSGIIIKNIRDYGQYELEDTADTYIFFDPARQLKSADTYVYDSNGELVLPSKRFNPDHPDIRSADIKRKDNAYAEAYDTKDDSKAEQMVRQAAIDADYDSPKLYHGTTHLDSTRLDTKNAADGENFFVTDSLSLAQSYSGVSSVRSINDDTTNTEYEDNKKTLDDTIHDIKNGINDLFKSNDTLKDKYSNKIDGIIASIDDRFNNADIENIVDKLYWLKQDAVNEAFNMAHMGTKLSWEDRQNLMSSFASDIDNAITKKLRRLPAIIKKLVRTPKAPGNYAFYGRTKNMLTIDANNNKWNQIPKSSLPEDLKKYFKDGYINTRLLGSYAKKEGYDGVIVKNVYDNGRKGYQDNAATVYIYNQPQRDLKSADTYAYDKNGDLIPLSKRFNPNHPDVRSADIKTKREIRKYDEDGMPLPKRNEITEEEARKRHMKVGGINMTPTYDKRFIVLNEDGTQKFDYQKHPVYSYAFRKSKYQSRYVSQKKYADTPLKYFLTGKKVTQMSPELKEFILNSNGNLAPSIQNRIDGEMAGTLTESYVFDFLRRRNDIDDVTFQAICDAFFRNDNFKTLKELDNRIEHGMQKGWAVRRLFRVLPDNPTIEKYSEVLTDENVDIDRLLETLFAEDENLEAVYNQLLNQFTMVKKRDILADINKGYARMRYLRYYDGTILSEHNVASLVRLIAILQYKTSQTDYDIEAEEEIEDAAAVSDLSRDEIIEQLVLREVGRVGKEALAQGLPYEKVKLLAEKAQRELIQKLTAMSNREFRAYLKTIPDLNSQIVEGIIMDTTGKFYNVTKTQKVEESSRNMMNKIRGAERTIRNNLTPKQFKEFTNAHSDIFDSTGHIRKELYANEVPNKTRRGHHYVNKEVKELQSLFNKISALRNEVKDRVKEVRAKNKAYTQSKHDYEKLQKERDKLKEALDKEKANKTAKNEERTRFKVDNQVLTIHSTMEMPYVLEGFLGTEFTRTAPTRVRNLSAEDERHTKMYAKNFYEGQAKELSQLTQKDVDDILMFYSKGGVPLEDITPAYIAVELWTLMYIIQSARRGTAQFVLSAEQLKLAESLEQNLSSIAGTGLSVWREAAKQLDPVKQVQSHIVRSCGLEIEDDDIDELLEAIESKNPERVSKAKADFEQKIMAQYADKKAGRSKLNMILNKILAWERLAMLSGPGTWVRNHASNILIMGTYQISDKMNGKLNDILMKLFAKRGLEKVTENQYTIAGTKIDDKVAEYIKVQLKDSGLLDDVFASLNKYDTRIERSKDSSVSVLTQMLVDSIAYKFSYNHLVEDTESDGALGNAIKKKGIATHNDKMIKTGERVGKMSRKTRKALSAAEKFVRKAISDDPYVRKMTMVYLGKMITEDLQRGKIKSPTELLSVNGPSVEFLTYTAEAFKIASDEFMHKPNLIYDFESWLAKKSNSAYFVYKQIFPFAGASWNWFVEGLKYTPMGLANAIIKFARLENTIAKMDESRRTFKHNDVGISSDFAQYLTLKDVNKGIIGSIGFAIGILLAAFGKARLDDRDDKYKIVLGDNNQVSIDVTKLFGTQGIFFGMAIVNAFEDDYEFGDAAIASFNQLSLDFVATDLFNSMRYYDKPSDWLSHQPYAMASMCVPNFLKTITSISQPNAGRKRYSNDFMGRVQRLAEQSIPFLKNQNPGTYIDPFTGDTEYMYKTWWQKAFKFHINYLNKLTPITVEPYYVSDMEKLEIEYGYKKGQLTGRYMVNGDKVKLPPKITGILNKKYADLNVASFKELENGVDRYRVKNPDGSFSEKRWNQMTAKEKAAVVNQTMVHNSDYAKIYILTSTNQYRYYASTDEFNKLRSLGITKNVYRAVGKTKGFVKSN